MCVPFQYSVVWESRMATCPQFLHKWEVYRLLGILFCFLHLACHFAEPAHLQKDVRHPTTLELLQLEHYLLLPFAKTILNLFPQGRP